MKTRLLIANVTILIEAMVVMVLVSRYPRSGGTDLLMGLQIILFIRTVVLIVRDLTMRTYEDGSPEPPKRKVYTNKYGATGPNPWPDHLMPGYRAPGPIGPTGYTGHPGPGAGTHPVGYTGYTGSTGSTGPSYTFGVRQKNIKKKL